MKLIRKVSEAADFEMGSSIVVLIILKARIL